MSSSHKLHELHLANRKRRSPERRAKINALLARLAHVDEQAWAQHAEECWGANKLDDIGEEDVIRDLDADDVHDTAEHDAMWTCWTNALIF